MVWDKAGAEADAVYSAVRVRISLQPRQIAHIDNADNSSLNLQCGDGAANLAIVGEFIATGESNTLPLKMGWRDKHGK